MNGSEVSPPMVTAAARVPPSSVVAPRETVCTDPGQVSFGISTGISHSWGRRARPGLRVLVLCCRFSAFGSLIE